MMAPRPAVAGSSPPHAKELHALLRAMEPIRAFEEQVRRLFAAGLIPGLVHLCAGQEAVVVGVCSQLRASDMIASNHCGHGHCLAKGADPKRLMAEIMGRRHGYGLGRGRLRPPSPKKLSISWMRQSSAVGEPKFRFLSLDRWSRSPCRIGDVWPSQSSNWCTKTEGCSGRMD
jgi:TPP-dependent pyruvate/acetoin dehydrogenase alpha subunit